MHVGTNQLEATPDLKIYAPNVDVLCRPEWGVTWIDSWTDLRALSLMLQGEDLISLDTETCDWKDRSKEYLSLIQIGIPRTRQTFMVDVIAMTDGRRIREESTLACLRPLLTRDRPVKVIQYAPFEQMQFDRSGIRLAGVHDTRAMAKILFPDMASYSLKDLVKELLGKELSKEEQGGDWSARPLSNNQQQYAALDPEITYAVYEKLEAIARERGLDLDTIPWRDMPRDAPRSSRPSVSSPATLTVPEKPPVIISAPKALEWWC